MAGAIHFLHIGKTGGSAIKASLRDHARRTRDRRFVLHRHQDSFATVLEEDADAIVFFVVRDPVARYISGFNSRLRQGRPYTDRPWSPREAEIFEKFQTPNALAEALSDERMRASAATAMRAIRHTGPFLADWLISPSFLEEHRRRIAFIGNLPDLDADTPAMRKALGLSADFSLPTGHLARHATPAGFERSLSQRSVANIKEWYRRDYPIFEWCMRFREQSILQRGAA